MNGEWVRRRSSHPPERTFLSGCTETLTVFTRIHHVAFIVEELDGWVDRFERVFDDQVITLERISGTFDLQIAFYAIDETLVEFITPGAGDEWASKHLADHGEGFFHIAFEVDDIATEMGRLEAEGYAFDDDAPRQGYDWLVATLVGPDLPFTVQLVEDSLTTEERIESFQ